MSEAMKKAMGHPESYNPKKPEIVNQIEDAIDKHGSEIYPENFVLSYKGTPMPPEIKHYGPATASYANEFAFFMDYAGQGYGFVFDGAWCMDRSYTIGNILSGHAMEPAPIFSKEGADYVWKTAGFSFCHTFYANPGKGDYMTEQGMKDAIKYALCTLEQPVVIPMDDFFCGSIVIGYKDNGNTLVTFRYDPYFMDMKNNARPRVEDVSDWYNKNTLLFIAGKRENELPISEIYHLCLRRIRECLGENIRGAKQHYYDDWEAFLRMSVDDMIAAVRKTGAVPGGEHGPNDVHIRKEESDDEMWKFICRTHDSTWCNMAERRFYVLQFFRQAKEYFPDHSKEFEGIADHFYGTNAIMGDGYGKEIGDPVNIEVFINPEIRARMANFVKEFKEADAIGLGMVDGLFRGMDVVE